MKYSTLCKAKASTRERQRSLCASAAAICVVFFATQSIKKGR